MLEKIPLGELSKFKAESETSDLHLYASTRKRVMRYRMVFFFIGIFFLFLSWIIYQKSSMWLTIQYKPFIDGIAFFLGIASLTVCTFLRYETEAVRALYHETLLKLRHIYTIRQSKALKDHDLPIIALIRKKIALHAHFKQKIGKLKKHEHETLDLMKRISRTKSLPLPEKELLYNQAVLELREKFNQVLAAYELGLARKPASTDKMP